MFTMREISFVLSGALVMLGAAAPPCLAQVQLEPPDRVAFVTQEWTGDRDRYGRPLVPDQLLARMKHVGLEEAWGVVTGAGYHNKFEGDWQIIHPGRLMVGRALTAAFLPSSPELEKRMLEAARAQGLQGAMNQFPIYMLARGDVYVADGFGKIRDGTLIGDNLAQAIYTNSGNGPVFYGSARDLAGLREIEGFNAWVKGWHPSYIREMMLASINAPIRIGHALVLPGDVVLATEGGVLFVPPHLVERVVLRSEETRLTDTFRKQRIAEGRYTLGDTYGTKWTEAIEADFAGWLQRERERLHQQLGVAYDTIDAMVTARSRD
jgi:4-hydroxy-4-methyl-2-oxoglutarate aldolase